jgi:LysM repeat protein
MGDFLGTLKSKAGPFPIWVWAAFFTALVAIVMLRRKNKSTTEAAADQTNSDLGSAAELANMFTVAGLMPYQGGDVYVNTTDTHTPPKVGTLPWQPPSRGSGPAPAPMSTYVVKKGDTISSIAKKHGISYAKLWQYNIVDAGRSKGAIKSLLNEGPNKLKPNQTILIPPKEY